MIPIECVFKWSASLLGAEGRAHVDAALRAGADLLVAHAHDAPVDGARHAVQHLHVELRQHEGRVDARLLDVALGGRVDHVPDLEALDDLVLMTAEDPTQTTQATEQTTPEARR